MDAMLVRQWRPITDQQNPSSREPDREFISLSDITGFLRQYVLSIVACVTIGLLAAGFHLATTDPVFTARTQILIEPKIPQLLQQQAADVNLSLDTAQVESQIAVMKSEKIATMLIHELKLLDDPKFNQPRSPTMVGRLQKVKGVIIEAFGLQDSAWLRSAGEFIAKRMGRWSTEAVPTKLSEFERNRRTMGIFRDGMDIRRLGVSYAIEMSFHSRDPDEAAKVANGMATAFMREQLETKAAAAREGGAWLERRLEQLRSQMNTATQAAQEFRARHDYRVGRKLDAAIVEGQVVYEEKDGGSETAPTLEELEVTADTYRKMYESFLQAYAGSVSQQSYPVADARVITAATRPLSASYPRPKLVLAFGLLAGVMGGVGLAFIRHTLDRSIRSPRQIREELGLACLGELPVVRGRTGGFGRLDEVVRSPQSRFSECMRGIKTAISLVDATQPIRWLGITSALPGDGKSCCASNLAMLYARSGIRTLVIDADIYHAALTNRLLTASTSLPAAIGVEGKPDPIIRHISALESRGFDILPSTTSKANHLLAPKNMQALLPDLQAYDLVIVDLPPLSSGADRLAVSAQLDGVILVVEWGKTPVDLVMNLVRSLKANKTTIFGVLMTKVRIMSTRRYRRYETHPPR